MWRICNWMYEHQGDEYSLLSRLWYLPLWWTVERQSDFDTLERGFIVADLFCFSLRSRWFEIVFPPWIRAEY